MNILAIESSCDETAAAIIQDGRHIKSNIIASQAQLHAQHGGVVPEVASRQHVQTAIPSVAAALDEAQMGWNEIDAIAVTHGPGLAGSLLVGVSLAKALAWARGLPLYGVNHIEAHIYSNWLIPTNRLNVPPLAPGEIPPEPRFPLLCLIVSGGHTDLILMTGHGQYRMLGRTRDDAAGEAFDKVARILGLSYPGGPAIQAAASSGNPQAVALPRAWMPGTNDFSFSGLKTAMLHLVTGDTANAPRLATATNLAAAQNVADLAASFQQAVIEVLVEKTAQAAEREGVVEVLLAGGVAANIELRSQLAQRVPLPVRYPPPILCTDNAAMIGTCAYYHIRYLGDHSNLLLDVNPNLSLIHS